MKEEDDDSCPCRDERTAGDENASANLDDDVDLFLSSMAQMMAATKTIDRIETTIFVVLTERANEMQYDTIRYDTIQYNTIRL